MALLRQLLHADSTNAEVAQALALAAGRLRDYDLAIKTYGDYLRLITPGAAEFVKFADLFLLARKVDQCESYVQYAREAGAETTEFYLLQARLWRLKGDYAQAIAASEAALKKIQLMQKHGAFCSKFLSQMRCLFFFSVFRQACKKAVGQRTRNN